MANPYVKQTWVDNNVANPTSAARMGVLETGIFDAHYQPAARVFHNASQNTTSGTPLTLAFNSEDFDQASNAADTQHDTVTNNSRLTCRYAGIYLVYAQADFAANATSYRKLTFIKNVGATVVGSGQSNVNTASNSSQVLATTIVSLAVNDYIQVNATQVSGSTLAVNSVTGESPIFGWVKVG